jgi:hypothetical protein
LNGLACSHAWNLRMIKLGPHGDHKTIGDGDLLRQGDVDAMPILGRWRLQESHHRLINTALGGSLPCCCNAASALSKSRAAYAAGKRSFVSVPLFRDAVLHFLFRAARRL